VHSIFIIFEIDIVYMKDKTIDYILRATWAVSRMYNEEASKYEPQWQLVLLY
jgi:hypothetical protein